MTNIWNAANYLGSSKQKPSRSVLNLVREELPPYVRGDEKKVNDDVKMERKADEEETHVAEKPSKNTAHSVIDYPSNDTMWNEYHEGSKPRGPDAGYFPGPINQERRIYESPKWAQHRIATRLQNELETNLEKRDLKAKERRPNKRKAKAIALEESGCCVTDELLDLRQEKINIKDDKSSKSEKETSTYPDTLFLPKWAQHRIATRRQNKLETNLEKKNLKAKERRLNKRKAEAIALEESGCCVTDELLDLRQEKMNIKDDKSSKSEKETSTYPYTLFLGQLSCETTEDEILEHFQNKLKQDTSISSSSLTSDIFQVRLLTDPRTKKSIGVAFFQTHDSRIMNSCLQLHHTYLNGRRINIEKFAGSRAKGFSSDSGRGVVNRDRNFVSNNSGEFIRDGGRDLRGGERYFRGEGKDFRREERGFSGGGGDLRGGERNHRCGKRDFRGEEIELDRRMRYDRSRENDFLGGDKQNRREQELCFQMEYQNNKNNNYEQSYNHQHYRVSDYPNTHGHRLGGQPNHQAPRISHINDKRLPIHSVPKFENSKTDFIGISQLQEGFRKERVAQGKSKTNRAIVESNDEKNIPGPNSNKKSYIKQKPVSVIDLTMEADRIPILFDLWKEKTKCTQDATHVSHKTSSIENSKSDSKHSIKYIFERTDKATQCIIPIFFNLYTAPSVCEGSAIDLSQNPLSLVDDHTKSNARHHSINNNEPMHDVTQSWQLDSINKDDDLSPKDKSNIKKKKFMHWDNFGTDLLNGEAKYAQSIPNNIAAEEIVKSKTHKLQNDFVGIVNATKVAPKLKFKPKLLLNKHMKKKSMHCDNFGTDDLNGAAKYAQSIPKNIAAKGSVKTKAHKLQNDFIDIVNATKVAPKLKFKPNLPLNRHTKNKSMLCDSFGTDVLNGAGKYTQSTPKKIAVEGSVKSKAHKLQNDFVDIVNATKVAPKLKFKPNLPLNRPTKKKSIHCDNFSTDDLSGAAKYAQSTPKNIAAEGSVKSKAHKLQNDFIDIVNATKVAPKLKFKPNLPLNRHTKKKSIHCDNFSTDDLNGAAKYAQSTPKKIAVEGSVKSKAHKLQNDFIDIVNATKVAPKLKFKPNLPLNRHMKKKSILCDNFSTDDLNGAAKYAQSTPKNIAAEGSVKSKAHKLQNDFVDIVNATKVAPKLKFKPNLPLNRHMKKKSIHCDNFSTDDLSGAAKYAQSTPKNIAAEGSVKSKAHKLQNDFIDIVNATKVAPKLKFKPNLSLNRHMKKKSILCDNFGTDDLNGAAKYAQSTPKNIAAEGSVKSKAHILQNDFIDIVNATKVAPKLKFKPNLPLNRHMKKKSILCDNFGTDDLSGAGKYTQSTPKKIAVEEGSVKTKAHMLQNDFVDIVNATKVAPKLKFKPNLPLNRHMKKKSIDWDNFDTYDLNGAAKYAQSIPENIAVEENVKSKTHKLQNDFVDIVNATKVTPKLKFKPKILLYNNSKLHNTQCQAQSSSSNKCGSRWKPSTNTAGASPFLASVVDSSAALSNSKYFRIHKHQRQDVSKANTIVNKKRQHRRENISNKTSSVVENSITKASYISVQSHELINDTTQSYNLDIAATSNDLSQIESNLKELNNSISCKSSNYIDSITMLDENCFERNWDSFDTDIGSIEGSCFLSNKRKIDTNISKHSKISLSSDANTKMCKMNKACISGDDDKDQISVDKFLKISKGPVQNLQPTSTGEMNNSKVSDQSLDVNTKVLLSNEIIKSQDNEKIPIESELKSKSKGLAVAIQYSITKTQNPQNHYETDLNNENSKISGKLSDVNLKMHISNESSKTRMRTPPTLSRPEEIDGKHIKKSNVNSIRVDRLNFICSEYVSSNRPQKVELNMMIETKKLNIKKNIEDEIHIDLEVEVEKQVATFENPDLHVHKFKSYCYKAIGEVTSYYTNCHSIKIMDEHYLYQHSEILRNTLWTCNFVDPITKELLKAGRCIQLGSYVERNDIIWYSSRKRAKCAAAISLLHWLKAKGVFCLSNDLYLSNDFSVTTVDVGQNKISDESKIIDQSSDLSAEMLVSNQSRKSEDDKKNLSILNIDSFVSNSRNKDYTVAIQRVKTKTQTLHNSLNTDHIEKSKLLHHGTASTTHQKHFFRTDFGGVVQKPLHHIKDLLRAYYIKRYSIEITDDNYSSLYSGGPVFSWTSHFIDPITKGVFQACRCRNLAPYRLKKKTTLYKNRIQAECAAAVSALQYFKVRDIFKSTNIAEISNDWNIISPTVAGRNLAHYDPKPRQKSVQESSLGTNGISKSFANDNGVTISKDICQSQKPTVCIDQNVVNRSANIFGSISELELLTETVMFGSLVSDLETVEDDIAQRKTSQYSEKSKEKDTGHSYESEDISLSIEKKLVKNLCLNDNQGLIGVSGTVEEGCKIPNKYYSKKDTKLDRGVVKSYARNVVHDRNFIVDNTTQFQKIKNLCEIVSPVLQGGAFSSPGPVCVLNGVGQGPGAKVVEQEALLSDCTSCKIKKNKNLREIQTLTESNDATGSEEKNPKVMKEKSTQRHETLPTECKGISNAKETKKSINLINHCHRIGTIVAPAVCDDVTKIKHSCPTTTKNNKKTAILCGDLNYHTNTGAHSCERVDHNHLSRKLSTVKGEERKWPCLNEPKNDPLRPIKTIKTVEMRRRTEYVEGFLEEDWDNFNTDVGRNAEYVEECLEKDRDNFNTGVSCKDVSNRSTTALNPIDMDKNYVGYKAEHIAKCLERKGKIFNVGVSYKDDIINSTTAQNHIDVNKNLDRSTQYLTDTETEEFKIEVLRNVHSTNTEKVGMSMETHRDSFNTNISTKNSDPTNNISFKPKMQKLQVDFDDIVNAAKAPAPKRKFKPKPQPKSKNSTKAAVEPTMATYARAEFKEQFKLNMPCDKIPVNEPELEEQADERFNSELGKCSGPKSMNCSNSFPTKACGGTTYARTEAKEKFKFDMPSHKSPSNKPDLKRQADENFNNDVNNSNNYNTIKLNVINDDLQEKEEQLRNFEEQERLLRQSANRTRFTYNNLKTSYQHQELFVRPSNVNDLPKDHWKWTDLYSRLGVPKHSSEIEIKKQFRKLALLYHPDKTKFIDGPARFQAVKEAYELLCKNK